MAPLSESIGNLIIEPTIEAFSKNFEEWWRVDDHWPAHWPSH